MPYSRLPAQKKIYLFGICCVWFWRENASSGAWQTINKWKARSRGPSGRRKKKQMFRKVNAINGRCVCVCVYVHVVLLLLMFLRQFGTHALSEILHTINIRHRKACFPISLCYRICSTLSAISTSVCSFIHFLVVAAAVVVVVWRGRCILAAALPPRYTTQIRFIIIVVDTNLKDRKTPKKKKI